MPGEEERRKKEKKEKKKKKKKIEIFKFGFSTLLKVDMNFWSRFSVTIAEGSSPEDLELLCFTFSGIAPIPYLQVAILNLLHP